MHLCGDAPCLRLFPVPGRRIRLRRGSRCCWAPGKCRRSKAMGRDCLHMNKSGYLFHFSSLLITSLSSFLGLNHLVTRGQASGQRRETRRRREVQLIGAGFRSLRKNQSCEERGQGGSQQDVCGWSSWHEVLAFMFIFGCIFLSLLMQISGLGCNPTGQDPTLPEVSTVF